MIDLRQAWGQADVGRLTHPCDHHGDTGGQVL